MEMLRRRWEEKSDEYTVDRLNIHITIHSLLLPLLYLSAPNLLDLLALLFPPLPQSCTTQGPHQSHAPPPTSIPTMSQTRGPFCTSKYPYRYTGHHHSCRSNPQDTLFLATHKPNRPPNPPSHLRVHARSRVRISHDLHSPYRSMGTKESKVQR
ncbi:hypothetical protein M011DRAFT_272177 [Sporormia fimetaria CBS 119925]|uniref:Uncharacterized protein n=1 Tax=Sporormia fimetaria CBS 119925 TaxID=1340428 RepID=A0A6A6VGA8_9PLEO|nr:hypothetical protein M011DRAFT_272177 [Sporormia fimetaria CBS 119925]